MYPDRALARPPRSGKPARFLSFPCPHGRTAELFRSWPCDETKRTENETIFRPGEDVPKPGLVTTAPTKRRAAKARKSTGDVMIKALSAITIAAGVAAALTVLPGFAPKVEASVPQALAKADRLDIRPVGKHCSQQAWPNFEASCLRHADTKAVVREVRLVTAERTP